MTGADSLFELSMARRYRVVVLVSAVDRRLLPALKFVSRLPFADLRAIHVSVDADDTRQVAHAWMELGLAWLPLHIREGGEGGVAAAVRRLIREEGDPDHVTVVVPELNNPRWWHRLLHRQRARRIATQLQPIDGVTTVIVPFTITTTDWRRPRFRSRDAAATPG